MPAFIGSSMAVLIEKPNRRSSLAFYVANVASDALFRIYVARGYVRPIKNGQVYMFTVAIATLMWLAKKHGFENDPMSSAIRLIVGGEEAGIRVRKSRGFGREEKSLLLMEEKELNSLDNNNNNNTTSDYKPNNDTFPVHSTGYNKLTTSERVRSIFNYFKFLIIARHDLCPHKKECSCFLYSLKASLRALLIGSTAQVGLKLVPKTITIILKNKANNTSGFLSTSNSVISTIYNTLLDFNSYKMGLFLSTFSGLFKLTNCLLRWWLNSSKPVNCFIAALVAGPALFIYPSPTVATYVLWKCFEALFHEAVRKDLIKNKDLFIIIMYGLATSQLFYSALMDPRYMKKSYMAFLDRMSEHKMHMINRSVLDIFGTQASSGYEDFFPDLHPKYMSRAFLGSIWIWMIEQKHVVASKC